MTKPNFEDANFHSQLASPSRAGSHCRESFFDKLPGANENRFVPFNNMPRIFSKYKNSDQALSFDKRVTRESSCIGGETGIEGKKEKYLQDYEANHEILKRPLSRGRKIVYAKIMLYRYKI